ncbi:hypothetical protein V8E55_009314 [Tylopilus felleus]
MRTETSRIRRQSDRMGILTCQTCILFRRYTYDCEQNASPSLWTRGLHCSTHLVCDVKVDERKGNGPKTSESWEICLRLRGWWIGLPSEKVRSVSCTRGRLVAVSEEGVTVGETMARVLSGRSHSSSHWKRTNSTLLLRLLVLVPLAGRLGASLSWWLKVFIFVCTSNLLPSLDYSLALVPAASRVSTVEIPATPVRLYVFGCVGANSASS